MSDVPWEQLPTDTTETCDYRVELPKKEGESGKEEILRTLGVPCGAKASWIHRGRCGCGACDMTMRHCQEHQERHLADQQRITEWAKKNVVHTTLPGGITMARRRNDQKDN